MMNDPAGEARRTGTIPEVAEERIGPVAVITLNRPERLNALSEDMHQRLEQLWRELDGDRTCRAAVVTGAGPKGFCVGMDLKENAARGGVRPASARATDVRDAARATPLRNGSLLPLVVAVNGICAGAGLHFVADADVVLCSPEATFTDTHVSVGQVAGLEPVALSHRVGVGHALRMAVLGRSLRLGAEEALRIGLVHEVVGAAELRSRAVEIAEAIARNSPASVAGSKRAIWSAAGRPLRDGLQLGFDEVRRHWEHPDSKEGPRAFSEKRPAQWDGDYNRSTQVVSW